MDFALRNLSVLAYANGFTLWHYRVAAPRAVLTRQDYFTEAADMLAQGDMLLASASDGAGIFCVQRSDTTVQLVAFS